MQINVADINVVAGTDAVIFSFINQGSTDALLFLSNLGDNTITYHFQENVDGTWTDLSAVTGPDPDFDNQVLTGTLVVSETRSIHLKSANPQVRLMALASGGSSLWFQVSRWALRGDGGALPILSF
jgi:hypothetical protein